MGLKRRNHTSYGKAAFVTASRLRLAAAVAILLVVFSPFAIPAWGGIASLSISPTGDTSFGLMGIAMEDVEGLQVTITYDVSTMTDVSVSPTGIIAGAKYTTAIIRRDGQNLRDGERGGRRFRLHRDAGLCPGLRQHARPYHLRERVRDGQARARIVCSGGHPESAAAGNRHTSHRFTGRPGKEGGSPDRRSAGGRRNGPGGGELRENDSCGTWPGLWGRRRRRI